MEKKDDVFEWLDVTCEAFADLPYEYRKCGWRIRAVREDLNDPRPNPRRIYKLYRLKNQKEAFGGK